ncbi:MAG: esterase family protein [Proteobacteria bacterium]|nr:esterase family protein [Pseudomonadota bacterium]MCP4917074.1 esterase family protein [Pseudomonadota bacterium]
MKLLHLRHESAALAGNPLGDAATRDVVIAVPDGPGPFPCLLALPGFTGSFYGFLNRRWRTETLPDRAARLVRQGMPPCVLVMPDVMTRIGGSQYLDSPSVGRYATWLCDELLPWVETQVPATGKWGVFGKSSGGFGALHLAMTRPERFQALAAHAPDAGFSYGYQPDFPSAVEAIRRAGGLEAWWAAFDRGGELSGSDHGVINLVAMSMCYASAESTPLDVELPVDLETGETLGEVFARWSAFDPVTLVPDHARALDGVAIWLDCGRRDEFRLQVGSRMLSRAFDQHEVEHHYEEHEGGHFKLNSRFELSLPFLASALT